MFWEALQNEEQGNLEKALQQMEKAANAHPKNEEYTNEMGCLAHALGRKDIELKAHLRLLLNLVKRSREKMIVFVKYLGTLESVAEFLDRRQIPYALFQGRMDSLEKEEQIRRFKEDKGILVTTEIGGEGRNLQFCNQMVNYDLPWNPMRFEIFETA